MLTQSKAPAQKKKAPLRRQHTLVAYDTNLTALVEFLDRFPTENEGSSYINWIDHYHVTTMEDERVAMIVTYHLEQKQGVSTY